ncbi:hypothetical protein CLPU_17c00100 [Gottschalkia purinilytica]|uniref:Prepilin-type N-terminal cleavage/methylation domain-containing protein n=1 Tax=Gottschalkia purinilytica TaxID=1503 RepID=A0A0L0W7W1_GOTPU|nr:type II secretion system protein [Gottschalkia purinilytica]KNF07385.1 hypothetical protein CLPU_17c00100 [Gottschalkia purinilytica]
MKAKINNKGTTMIEVVVSITILSLLTLPIITLFYESVKMNKKSQEQMTATILAENFIEDIKTSENLNIGQVTKYENGFNINIKIEEIEKELEEQNKKDNICILNESLFKITVEIVKENTLLEKIVSYKLII